MMITHINGRYEHHHHHHERLYIQPVPCAISITPIDTPARTILSNTTTSAASMGGIGLSIKSLKRDRSTSHMKTCSKDQPATLLPSFTTTPVKTLAHITHQTCCHDVNLLVPSCSSSTTSVSSASLSGSESRSTNKSPTNLSSSSILQRTTPKRSKSITSQQNDNDSSSDDLSPSNNVLRSFNACKMKSNDLKNKFTTSRNDQVIRCNRTSGNQRSYIGYQDIKEYFFLPEGEAAKRLGCSKSKLKRIKTRLNIERWPFRRIQSLLNQKQNALSKNENVEDIEMAVQFVVDYPNLITKYSNEDIVLTATRFDRVKISNLL